MPSLDFTEGLARLLSDSALRESFVLDPSETLARLDIRAEDRPLLAEIRPDDLQAQALCLLDKRWHEVLAWMPNTARTLGVEGRERFHRYANRHWPTGPTDSLHDAIGFCRLLRDVCSEHLCTMELNRLELLASQKRWAIHIARNARIGGYARTVVQLLVRRSGRGPAEMLFYWAWPTRTRACSNHH